MEGAFTNGYSAGQRYGYARVSKRSQNEARQLEALREKCDVVRVEKASAVKARPVFDQLLADLRARDTLVILDLDRAFRSVLQAIQTATLLREREINLVILNAGIDTSNEFGEVVFGILALLADFERKVIVRRTKEGLAAARKRGVRLGRPYALSDAQIRRAHHRISSGQAPAYKVAARLDVSPATLVSGFTRLGL
ncbi:recombinase family protein [Litorimonas sp.]|uniref:recombinase family protein n=1 Tax=Litorimonas sp. TaxID=1892381 RepID=UPI003A88586D